MSACRLHIPDCWDPWQLYRYSVSVPLFLVTNELFCGLPGVRQPLASQTKLPTSCPLLLPRSYAESRLIRQMENVESSERALKPGCPIFAATEKRYYPYSLGVPVDPIPTSLFLCQFQQLSSLLIIYTCTSFWLKLLATWEGRRKRSTIFSFLLKNWREWSTLFSWEPFGLWSAIWCLRTCQPLLSDSPMIYLSCAEPIPVSTAFPASSLLKWKGNIGGQ